MINVPLIIQGSWFSSSERKVRSLFHVAIIVEITGAGDELVGKIAGQLERHYMQNENFTAKVFVGDGVSSIKEIEAEGCNIALLLKNKNSCDVGVSGSRFQSDCSTFEAIDTQVKGSFNNFVMDLAVKYVNKDERY